MEKILFDAMDLDKPREEAIDELTEEVFGFFGGEEGNGEDNLSFHLKGTKFEHDERLHGNRNDKIAAHKDIVKDPKSSKEAKEKSATKLKELGAKVEEGGIEEVDVDVEDLLRRLGNEERMLKSFPDDSTPETKARHEARIAEIKSELVKAKGEDFVSDKTLRELVVERDGLGRNNENGRQRNALAELDQKIAKRKEQFKREPLFTEKVKASAEYKELQQVEKTLDSIQSEADALTEKMGLGTTTDEEKGGLQHQRRNLSRDRSNALSEKELILGVIGQERLSEEIPSYDVEHDDFWGRSQRAEQRLEALAEVKEKYSGQTVPGESTEGLRTLQQRIKDDIRYTERVIEDTERAMRSGDQGRLGFDNGRRGFLEDQKGREDYYKDRVTAAQLKVYNVDGELNARQLGIADRVLATRKEDLAEYQESIATKGVFLAGATNVEVAQNEKTTEHVEAFIKDTKLKISSEEFYKLAGAGDDAGITVSSDRPEVINLESSDGYENTRKVITNRSTGEAVLVNEYFRVKKTGQGIGTEIFARQVQNAQEAGVAYIETNAARGGNYNGYYTWPRLGYDAELYLDTAEAAQEDFADSTITSVSDLMHTQERRDWWRENGTDMSMTFDLSEDSYSMRTLRDYLIEKGKLDGE